MSIATLLGFLAGLGLFVGAIVSATDNYSSFLSGPSIIMVLGGTLSATFIGYQARYVMLALEKEIKGAKKQDHFLNYGIELVISGYSGDEVRSMLSAASTGAFQRAMVQADILKNMAAAAPAFGMIGTLVGLIVMLQSLGPDPGGLGAGLAVAMLTTLYGVLLARMIFLPASSKVIQKEGILRFRNFLVTEGFSMLADHKSPRYIQDKMNSYLDPSIHYTMDPKGGKRKKAA